MMRLFPVCLLLASALALHAGKKPHIVLMMADDQGWGDVGYNGHPFVRTPNLDAMAAAGHVFDRFYAAAPVCSPTRASVFTGRSPLRTRVLAWGHYLHPAEETLASTLRDAGYVTGMFGKFHIGSAQPESPCNPGAMGFDEWCVALNFFDNDPYLSRNGVVERRKGKGSALLMDDTIEFLKRYHRGGKPMFAVAWFPSPHDPHREVPDGPALYEGRKHAGYYREITLLDQQVGRLRAALRELGIEDNTIVWYCSDNGGLVSETAGGRNRKGSIYEGGLRVPGIIEWPAKQLGGRSAVPAATQDIHPTLMAMAGIGWTPRHPIDGQDLTPVIAGRQKFRKQPLGFWSAGGRGVSTHSDQILVELHKKQQQGGPTPHLPERITGGVYEMPEWPVDHAKGHAAWLDWPWKLHRINGERHELYHLGDDPHEARDLSAEPVHAERLVAMKARLSEWMKSVTASYNGMDYR